MRNASENAKPGLGFTVYDVRGGPTIGHEAFEKPGIFVTQGTLARIIRSGALSKTEKDSFGYLFLMPAAADVLEQERRLRGESPLASAEARIAHLEAAEEQRDARRHASARKFGRVVRWIILPAALLLVAIIAWAAAGPLAGVGTFVALGVLYAVVTTGLGITGLQAAKAAEDAATQWAERRLARWTDPDAP